MIGEPDWVQQREYSRFPRDFPKRDSALRHVITIGHDISFVRRGVECPTRNDRYAVDP